MICDRGTRRHVWLKWHFNRVLLNMYPEQSFSKRVQHTTPSTGFNASGNDFFGVLGRAESIQHGRALANAVAVVLVQ